MAADPLTALGRLLDAASDGRVDALARRHGIRVLTAFGSAARGRPDARDLDLAVRFEPHARPDLLALHDDLAALTGSDDVDLLVLDRADPVAKEAGLVGVVPLYQSERGAYADLQMAAMCERMDTEHLRRAQLDLLSR